MADRNRSHKGASTSGRTAGSVLLRSTVQAPAGNATAARALPPGCAAAGGPPGSSHPHEHMLSGRGGGARKWLFRPSAAPTIGRVGQQCDCWRRFGAPGLSTAPQTTRRRRRSHIHASEHECVRAHSRSVVPTASSTRSGATNPGPAGSACEQP